MDSLLQEMKMGLQTSPAWLQILWQAYAYSILCWALDSVEAGGKFIPEPLHTSMELVDTEFLKFPYGVVFDGVHGRWQETIASLNPSKTQLEEDAEHWCQTIQEVCQPSIEIFSTLYDGQELSDERWEELYNEMALKFGRPEDQMVTKRPIQRTMRSKGRRAITPIRRRKGFRGTTMRSNGACARINKK